MAVSTTITPCLWFDTQAEEAARFYTSVFPNSRVVQTTRYPAVGEEIHHKTPGSVMIVEFELDGQPFTALNGGPDFTFNEALSLQIECDTQQEIDHYWAKLTPGGDQKAQMCGWLKDRFGVSWQVTPRQLKALLNDHQSPEAKRAMQALLEMKKIDIAGLERAVASVR